MRIDELAVSKETTKLSRRTATLLLHGLKHGFDAIDIGMEEFDSVYPGLTYKLFHRHLPLPSTSLRKTRMTNLENEAEQWAT